ncbi:GNAT family N-acetyltransferase [Parenemella sanctibonifatiensis]|uniref:GNAT family N-acetyltransferase n=1 Tax=Parenemella sanctibonifatiensis TaxID=2016505 RepID=UPI001E480C07|nr:N-acetyltransferase [Parenemella sanctibonifatiensis]
MTDAAADLTIRPAAEADLPVISQLVNLSYRGDSSRVGWTTEADLLAGQRTDVDSLAAEPGTLWVAVLTEDPSDLVGCFRTHVWGEGGEADETATTGAGYIGMVTVRPFHQGAGYGAYLLGEAERILAEAGHDQAVMTVIDARADLIDWYIRHGYRLTDERLPFPMDDPRFGIPLVDHLAFAVLVKDL